MTNKTEIEKARGYAAIRASPRARSHLNSYKSKLESLKDDLIADLTGEGDSSILPRESIYQELDQVQKIIDVYREAGYK